MVVALCKQTENERKRETNKSACTKSVTDRETQPQKTAKSRGADAAGTRVDDFQDAVFCQVSVGVNLFVGVLYFIQLSSLSCFFTSIPKLRKPKKDEAPVGFAEQCLLLLFDPSRFAHYREPCCVSRVSERIPISRSTEAPLGSLQRILSRVLLNNLALSYKPYKILIITSNRNRDEFSKTEWYKAKCLVIQNDCNKTGNACVWYVYKPSAFDKISKFVIYYYNTRSNYNQNRRNKNHLLDSIPNTIP